MFLKNTMKMRFTKTKWFIVLTFAIITLFSACLNIQRRHKIIFFGDSITYNGLNWKYGFINEIDSIIQSKGFEFRYQLEGAGEIRNRVGDLYNRLDKDVIQYNPDLVIIYIGINDVNNGNPEIESSDFEKTYCSIIEQLIKNNIKVIICTPTVIGDLPNSKNPKDKYLDAYSTIIKGISKRYPVSVCDLRSTFANYINKTNVENKDVGILTVDGVHLNRMGNFLVAQDMWKVITSEWK